MIDNNAGPIEMLGRAIYDASGPVVGGQRTWEQLPSTMRNAYEQVAEHFAASDWLAAHDAALLERVEAAEGVAESNEFRINNLSARVASRDREVTRLATLVESERVIGDTIDSERHEAAADRDVLAAKVAAVRALIEIAERHADNDLSTMSVRAHIAQTQNVTLDEGRTAWPAMVSTTELRAVLDAS